jgi:hypothetical protein
MDKSIASQNADILMPYFIDIVKRAPSYGWCGLTVTFHDGKATKIEKNMGITIKPESQSGNS